MCEMRYLGYNPLPPLPVLLSHSWALHCKSSHATRVIRSQELLLFLTGTNIKNHSHAETQGSENRSEKIGEKGSKIVLEKSDENQYTSTHASERFSVYCLKKGIFGLEWGFFDESKFVWMNGSPRT